jgi:hypothetical protein
MNEHSNKNIISELLIRISNFEVMCNSIVAYFTNESFLIYFLEKAYINMLIEITYLMYYNNTALNVTINWYTDKKQTGNVKF